MLIFRTASLVGFPANVRRSYDIDRAFIWRHNIISTSFFYCNSSYYLRNCSTYNSPLCLRSNNVQSVFDFIVIVVALILVYPISGRQLVILFGFCVVNFLQRLWYIDFILLQWFTAAMWKIKLWNNKFSYMHCTNHTFMK